MDKQLDVRFDKKVYRMTVTREVGSAMVCEDPTIGLKVICYPSGRADVEKTDPRSGIPLYNGLASWNTPVGDSPADVLIRIARGTELERDDGQRRRVIDRTITVWANIDYENMGYVFARDGSTWFVPLDKAEEVK